MNTHIVQIVHEEIWLYNVLTLFFLWLGILLMTSILF